MPGAITSGLKRPSFVGPRLLNATTCVRVVRHRLRLERGDREVVAATTRRTSRRRSSGRLFSHAPTVMQFFAVRRRADAHRVDLRRRRPRRCRRCRRRRRRRSPCGRRRTGRAAGTGRRTSRDRRRPTSSSGSARPACTRRRRARFRSRRDAGEQEAAEPLEVGRVLPLALLLDRLEGELRPVREAADRAAVARRGRPTRRRCRATEPEVWVPWPLSRSAGPSSPPGFVT